MRRCGASTGNGSRPCRRASSASCPAEHAETRAEPGLYPRADALGEDWSIVARPKLEAVRMALAARTALAPPAPPRRAPAGGFAAGDRIFHQKFGHGTVQRGRGQQARHRVRQGRRQDGDGQLRREGVSGVARRSAALWRVLCSVRDVASAEAAARAFDPAVVSVSAFAADGDWRVEGLTFEKPDRAAIEANLALQWLGRGEAPAILIERLAERDWLDENQKSFAAGRGGTVLRPSDELARARAPRPHRACDRRRDRVRHRRARFHARLPSRTRPARAAAALSPRARHGTRHRDPRHGRGAGPGAAGSPPATSIPRRCALPAAMLR